MRSSIACIRCRRSKVKCVNNGVGTICRSCENSGRDCQYPSPVAGGSRRRDSISGRADVYGDAERRQRPRKSTATYTSNSMTGPSDSPRPLLDALDPRLLTPAVWQELFDIFQVHFSADLPFLHPPTFLKPLRSATLPPPPSHGMPVETLSSARPPASTEFLLAFLALTARFHPRLVAHHSPPTSSRPSNPLIASEYYAAAANEKLASIWTDNRTHDIERCQAALMLGLHEWGMCRGGKAWLTIGLAIRAAQSMGLQYEMDLDDEPLSRSIALSGEAERMGMDSTRKSSVSSSKSIEDAFILQEIRRRTFWSCYIMDRYLSSGKYRPQMLHARELRIQLPASERAFLFAEKVRTLMLGEEDTSMSGPGRAEVQNQRQQSVMLGTTGTPEPNMAPSRRNSSRDDEDKGRLEVGFDEGLISRYVKMLEIYGKVIKWSCAGGRRTEEHPPWDDRGEFYKLRRMCQEFKASLPRQQTLTPQNTQAHISLKTSTPYTLMHAVYLLCLVMLHREYVPFIPIRCSKPEGPVDAPLFPADKFNVPAGFWDESARECFRSAREIMDLVRTCQEWRALVETPIIGFAVYTVAFTGVYCINFPWMDPDGFMCTKPEPGKPDSKPGESEGFEAARKALEMIGNMRTKLHMANGWFSTINRMHRYYRRIKSDYRKNVHSVESSSEGDSPVSTRHLSLREGGSGGGLDEFKLLERTLKEFGNLEDQDVDMTEAQRPDSRPLDAVYDDSNSGTVKSEEGDRPATTTEPLKTENGAWSAINTAPGAPASRHASISTPSSAQFRSYDTYAQQQHQSQQNNQQHAGQYPPNGHSQPPSSGPSPNQPPHHHQPHHGYQPPQLSNFRPSYSEGPSPIPGPPSLTSPASQSAAGTTPSQSHASPPFERHHSQPGYSSWTPQNGQYQMQPPPPNPYVNGATHHYPPQQHGPPPQHGGYPTPAQSAHPQQPLQPHHQQPPQPQQVWDPTTKEAWLSNIDTRMGGDDIAAFVEGGEVSEWANMAASQGFAGGWLTAVWGNGPA